MVALERTNVSETVPRKNNGELNFCSMYFFEITKKYIRKIADTSFKDLRSKCYGVSPPFPKGLGCQKIFRF